MIDFDKNPNVVALCKKIITLQGEKVRVESIEASLHQKLENAKRDRADVVSNVVLNVATKLVQSDDMEPFDITKVKGYRSSYMQEHTKAGNDLTTATFPFLTDIVADPYASVEATSSPALMYPPPHVISATAASLKAQSLPLV
uniref:Uncharacterized protein n=1 Tax=Tanacetum cinerariifolium TaxID=118510 RepID=A0A6L2LPJ9_TANCI|nr:hypothetical protein [Tanacetum cinerariifolium]